MERRDSKLLSSLPENRREGGRIENPVPFSCIVNVNADDTRIRFHSLRSVFTLALIVKALHAIRSSAYARALARTKGLPLLESHERAARVLEREERDVKVKSDFPW